MHIDVLEQNLIGWLTGIVVDLALLDDKLLILDDSDSESVSNKKKHAIILLKSGIKQRHYSTITAEIESLIKNKKLDLKAFIVNNKLNTFEKIQYAANCKYEDMTKTEMSYHNANLEEAGNRIKIIVGMVKETSSFARCRNDAIAEITKLSKRRI